MPFASTDKTIRIIEDSRHLLDALLRCLLSKDPISKAELDAVLGTTIRKLCDTLQAQSVLVLMFDLSGHKAVLENAYFSPSLYSKGEDHSHKIAEKAQKSGSLNLTAECFGEEWKQISAGRSVNTSDAVSSADFFRVVQGFTGFPMRSILAVPLVVNGATVGCIQVINKFTDGQKIDTFDAQDQKLLEDVATYASKALLRMLDPETRLGEAEAAECVARLAKFDSIDLEKEWQPDYPLLRAVGEEKVNRYQILPLGRVGENGLRVALSNPLDLQMLGDFEIVAGMKVVEKRVASPSAIKTALGRAFPTATPISAAVESVHKSFEVPAAAIEAAGKDEDEESEVAAPIIKLANRIIEDAYQQGASDIHIEPQEEKLVVRYRIDGVCRVKLVLPALAHPPLVSRYKIMSEMDISEHRLPQDGRLIFKKFSPDFDLDLRVSVMPTNHGENVVMRILDKKKSTLPLEKLGFSDYNLKNYRKQIQAPYGMILHCGPTGSGKSMTLYAALNEINSPDVKILTAEDPIEYTLPQINQIQVRKDIGLTFASCLRSFLRQDPDIILVGEVRDRETAEIAVEAALTGHLLFSTLHTNDAPSTVTRLVEIGVEPFLISSTLVCVCAQRLLRRLCKCHSEVEPTPEERALLLRAKGPEMVGTIGKPVGCEICDKTGYKGRTGIHELLECRDDLRELINKSAPGDQLKRAARHLGMRTLFEDAMEKVKLGITSMAEATSTALPDEDPGIR